MVTLSVAAIHEEAVLENARCTLRKQSQLVNHIVTTTDCDKRDYVQQLGRTWTY